MEENTNIITIGYCRRYRVNIGVEFDEQRLNGLKEFLIKHGYQVEMEKRNFISDQVNIKLNGVKIGESDLSKLNWEVDGELDLEVHRIHRLVREANRQQI
ncbi:hypothetical protein SNEBB_010421 [Seison nebaliae]|nr:hypothetical protein SNEBB_010421 [Seison nebaliae]